MAATSLLPADAAQITASDLQLISLPVVLESLLYGMFVLIYAYAVLSLFGKRSFAHRGMLVATTIMFTSASTHWALELYSLLQVLRDPYNYRVRSNYLSQSTALTIALGINFFFSDAIVLWRACVLWKRNRIVYGVSAALLSCTLIFEALDVAFTRRRVPHIVISFPTPVVLYDNFGTVCVLSSLLANVWATVLVGIKAWRYRRGIRKDLRQSSSTDIVQKVMSLLLECGALYCLLWVLFIIGFMTDPNASVLGDRETIMNSSFTYITAQITGIYPTIIVVLVRYRRTYNEQTFNPSTMSNEAFPAPARNTNITIPWGPADTYELTSIDLELHHALPQPAILKTPPVSSTLSSPVQKSVQHSVAV